MKRPASIIVIPLLILAPLAGCTGTTQQKEIAPGETLAPPYKDLADLVLQPEDLPFAGANGEQPATADAGTGGLQVPAGASRSRAAVYRPGAAASSFPQAVWQEIYEYTDEAGMPARYQEMKDAADTRAKAPGNDTRVLVHPDPVVGHRSFAYTTYSPNTPAENPETVLVFYKFAVLEVLRMKNRTVDFELLEKIADKAAAKIPGGRVRYASRATPAPAPSGTPQDYSTVDHADPLQAMAVSDGAIGRLLFNLKLRQGKAPEDMEKMTFHVYVSKGRRSSNLIHGNDPAVQVSWPETKGWKNSLLEEGEVTTVSLDLSAMNFTLTPDEMNSGLVVYASGFGTPTHGFSWCKNFPTVLVNGNVYEC